MFELQNLVGLQFQISRCKQIVRESINHYHSNLIKIELMLLQNLVKLG